LKCYKRRNEDEEEPVDNENMSDSNPFKSAKEQLLIESTKQSNQNQNQSSGYSLAKRPMNNLPKFD
jgi:hypothetical protein